MEWSIIIFIVCILIVILVFLIFLGTIDINRILNDSNENDNVFDYFKNFQTTSGEKRDCSVETIYSMTDEQCDAICRDTGQFRTSNGICVNILAFDQEIVNSECSPQKGLVAYMVGDTQTGTANLRCLSVDPGVRPDNITLPNTICINGQIDINYLTDFPQRSNCKCANSYQKLYEIANTQTIRRRGVCAPRTLLPVYLHSNLVYDSNRFM